MRGEVNKDRELDGEREEMRGGGREGRRWRRGSKSNLIRET